MNSILGPAAAGITCFFTRKYISSDKKEVRSIKWDPMSILNGVLCGLVAITGNCAVITDWGAIIIGGIAPIWYAITLRIIEKL
jgi:ammonia channel protein AmtB